jgi:hypothetical protein
MEPAKIGKLVEGATDRFDLWARLVVGLGIEVMAEVGVWRGDFARAVLDRCDELRTYYMIDPWRHLDDWNKPRNDSDEAFEAHRHTALERTAAYESKRVVLRGRTVDVVDEIADGGLDLAYLDGDHTLRGITIDMTMMFPKVRVGGWIGGDDFTPSIFQHGSRYEPTLVFPFAVHFAEAVGGPIVALPHNQFLMQKTTERTHSFTDLTGKYTLQTLRDQLDRSAERRRTSALLRLMSRFRQ